MAMEHQVISLENAAPSEIRQELRKNKLKNKPTTFYSLGYTQTNIAILPEALAGDFKMYADRNTGAIPLIYQSKVGQYSCPEISADSDIRTDLPSYTVFKKGEHTGTEESLKDYDLSEFVTFYIGCSFTLNKIFLDHGIFETADSRNVAMYRSNIETKCSGPFRGPMVVSMRAIRKEKLSQVASLTWQVENGHGSPIHYGNPNKIGITCLSQIDYGEVTPVKSDEVPVFWCCGVTALEAIKNAKPSVSFTHSPGCMYISDLKQDPIESSFGSKVINYCHDSYSSLSEKSWDNLGLLERITQQDPGHRGIHHIVKDDDFGKAALALSHAESVAIITGFPVHESIPDETDGVTGCISLTDTLLALGKQVTWITDPKMGDLHFKLLKEFCETTLCPQRPQTKPYNPDIPISEQLYDGKGKPLYNVIISCERVGRAKDGRYYTMKGIDISQRISTVDVIFEAAQKSVDICTVAIGDGGNEVGMGTVLNQVETNISKGELIACSIPSDLLLSCGVSNWGCYALGLALVSLKKCPVHDRYLRRGIGTQSDVKEELMKRVASIEREEAILALVEKHGIRDGMRPGEKMSVDGMYFKNEHSDAINQMRSAVEI